MQTPSRLLLAAILTCWIQCQDAFSQDKPNIVLILADDLGYSDLGCYGGEIETPSLDRLAHEGMRFTQFTNSGKCEPSRASLMSGQYWVDTGLGVKRGMTLGQAMTAGHDPVHAECVPRT